MKFKNKQKNYGLRSHDSVYPWRDGVMTGRDYKWGLGILVIFFLYLGGGYPDVFTCDSKSRTSIWGRFLSFLMKRVAHCAELLVGTMWFMLSFWESGI